MTEMILNISVKMKAEGKEKEFPTLGIALKTYKGENL